MITPDLTFQAGIRRVLTDDTAVTDLVPAEHIRSGFTRPENFPSVLLASPQTINLGRASGGYFVTRVYLDLHVWAIQDGADKAQKLGGAVAQALWDAPAVQDVIHVESEYERPSFRYMRDPDPDRAFCHGVGTVGGVIQWRM